MQMSQCFIVLIICVVIEIYVDCYINVVIEIYVDCYINVVINLISNPSSLKFIDGNTIFFMGSSLFDFFLEYHK